MPRKENGRVDALADIVVVLPINETIMLPVYLKVVPSITSELVCNANQANLRWMLDIKKYLEIGEVLEDEKKVHKFHI